MSKHEYYIHEAYNGNKRICETCCKVTRRDYSHWDDLFPVYDCFDEDIINKGDTQEHHLYLDAGDIDDPADVITTVYDWTC